MTFMRRTTDDFKQITPNERPLIGRSADSLTDRLTE
jgi:hypothetical protein